MVIYSDNAAASRCSLQPSEDANLPPPPPPDLLNGFVPSLPDWTIPSSQANSSNGSQFTEIKRLNGEAAVLLERANRYDLMQFGTLSFQEIFHDILFKDQQLDELRNYLRTAISLVHDIPLIKEQNNESKRLHRKIFGGGGIQNVAKASLKYELKHISLRSELTHFSLAKTRQRELLPLLENTGQALNGNILNSTVECLIDWKREQIQTIMVDDSDEKRELLSLIDNLASSLNLNEIVEDKQLEILVESLLKINHQILSLFVNRLQTLQEKVNVTFSQINELTSDIDKFDGAKGASEFILAVKVFDGYNKKHPKKAFPFNVKALAQWILLQVSADQNPMSVALRIFESLGGNPQTLEKNLVDCLKRFGGSLESILQMELSQEHDQALLTKIGTLENVRNWSAETTVWLSKYEEYQKLPRGPKCRQIFNDLKGNYPLFSIAAKLNILSDKKVLFSLSQNEADKELLVEAFHLARRLIKALRQDFQATRYQSSD